MITYQTPLIQIPQLVTADQVRRAMVANALSLVDQTAPPDFIGLQAGDPATRAAFEGILGPGRWDLDRPFHMWTQEGKTKTQGVSTCAMVALGLLRRLLIDCEDILDGYADDIGSGLDVAIEYAMHLVESHGALQLPGYGLRPGPGDIVQVLGEMHVLTACWWEGDVLVSVDGGQTGLRGLQACKLRRRKWEVRADGPYLGGRKVAKWICVDLCGFRDGLITVPEGWELIAA